MIEAGNILMIIQNDMVVSIQDNKSQGNCTKEVQISAKSAEV